MLRNRLHCLAAASLMVVVGLVATSGASSAPARDDASSAPPPVERVARELRTGAKSLIVFVSAGDKEYVATAGSRRPTADQRFRIGSVTKTFTATVVLQLVEEGDLRLDSTLEEHVPGVVPRGKEITIRHLLQHRSGLANITDYPSWLERALRSSSTRPIDTLRFAGSKPLLFKPGTQGRYSNTNYIALGLVIETVTGRTYAEELEQRILEPLGLDRTELPETRRLPDLDDGGYNPNVPWAAGAIVSTVRDLSRFYSALLSGRLLSSASLATMKNAIAGAGLGIWSTELPCGRSWGHGGLILDYETSVGASEEGDRVAVVSVRGGRGPLPPVGRALLCAEPPLAAGSPRAGSKIAFLSMLGPGPAPLYVMNADGTGPGWLTLNAAGPPAWSPDGRRIAFASVRDGNSEVYLMNADGSGQRNLTHKPAEDFSPAWSPDGQKIAFIRERARRSDVYVMNADGSGQGRLTRNAAPAFGLAWSSDGRKIAFLSKRTGNWEIYVANADGSGLRNLTQSPAPDGDFSWSSPDGRRIAFLSKRDGNWNVYVMNADGSGQRRLTRDERTGELAWSPDGRRIAFAGLRAGNWDVYVMNADGSGQRRLTRNAAYDGGPVWSPDGRRIAFGSGRDGNGEIYVMNADGSGQRNLTRSPWHERGFSWSPVRR